MANKKLYTVLAVPSANWCSGTKRQHVGADGEPLGRMYDVVSVDTVTFEVAQVSPGWQTFAQADKQATLLADVQERELAAAAAAATEWEGC